MSHRPHRTLPLVLAALVAAVLLVGCGVGNPHQVGTYERAAFFADKGKNLEAVGAFERFIRANPTDSLAAEAQFRKAMTYLELKEYPLAAVEFQILRKDYPTSDRIEDAHFQEGRAYLLKVGDVARDVTGAYEARLHFLEFSQLYPDSRHMPEVVGYMQQISDLMVRKRLEQIKVYAQLKRYPAIAVVLDNALKNEAGSTLIPQVLWERGRVARRLDDAETAEEMFERLVGEYPDSPYARRARGALDDLVSAEADED